MRKTLSLILALVLAFSLAAVPAFAADTTEAETSTSDTAHANGWVGGYADGTFHPNQTITRAEAVTILNRVLWPQLRPDVRAGQCAGSVALYRRHTRRMVLRCSHRGLGRPHLYGADRH